MPTPEQELRARGSPVFLTYQFCCLAYLMLIFLTVGNLVVFNPSFKLDNFYVPALNKAANSTHSTLLFFKLIIHNDMPNVGFRYDAVNLTFSYVANASSATVLATYTVPGFYQGMNNKKARRRDVAVVSSSEAWKEAALRDVSGAGFRVDAETRVKMKNLFWYFRHKRITASGIVVVGDSGKIQNGESVELKSSKNPSKVEVAFFVIGFLILILVGVLFIVYGVLYFFSELQAH